MENRQGKFTASNISKLLATGTGKTRMSYIYEVAEDFLGLRKDFDNPHMKHGRTNEKDAFDFAVKPNFKDAIFQSDVYIPINENCGASPDVLIGKDTLDIKCPTLFKYFEYIKKVPLVYKLQVQMQLMASRGQNAYLCFYLTKPVDYMSELWEEYEFDSFDDNHFIIKFEKDQEIQDTILIEVDLASPIRFELVEIMSNAENIELKDAFKMIKQGKKIIKLKDTDYLKQKEVFMLENEFIIFA